MNQIKTFKNEMFGTIRTLISDRGETFFIGKDVAKALGYNNTRDALNKHVDREDKLVSQIATSGQRRNVILYFGLNGERKQRSYMVWTPKGKDYILKNLLNGR